MAANQRKKRINASSFIACTSREQYKLNRKKFQSQQHKLNMRPNITLEWDKSKKLIVSKRDQIGIAQRHIIPFTEPYSHGHSTLADVISVPQEIFDIENLKEVLSYEVWQGYLSDKERNFLCQFVPKEPDPDRTVRDLLAGDNFHFGNPFLKWGKSLCSGKLHPDNVLLEGQKLKAAKKAYYLHLQKYHNDIIEILQMWKTSWLSCNDPGVGIEQHMWSTSRKHAGQSMLPSETGSYGTEEHLGATSESCSYIDSEVVCSSDSQKHENSQRRKYSFSNRTDRSNELKGTSVLKKGIKIRKRNIHNADGTEYMSYIKVSKEQHELVKSCMKHAGNNIQPKSLDSVLGCIDNLNIQPFERYEEEVRNKLHNHWLKLARKEIPKGFSNWEKRQLQRQGVIRSLHEELTQKPGHQLVSLDGGKHDFHNNKRMRFSDDMGQEILSSNTFECVEKELTDDLLQEQTGSEGEVHKIFTGMKDEKEIKTGNIYEQQIHPQTRNMEDEDDNVPSHVLFQDPNGKPSTSLNNDPRSTIVTPPNPSLRKHQHQHQHQQPISSFNCNPHSNSMKIESNCDNTSAKTNGDPPMLSQYSGILNNVDIPVNQGVLLPSVCDVWPVLDVRGSYNEATAANAGYMPSQELAIGHPQFLQERFLDLENNSRGKDAGNEMLHRLPEDIPFFSSYSTQDRNELLQSFFKGQSNNMSYHHQQKQAGLDFQPGTDLILEEGPFTEFRDQHHPSIPLDPRQKRPTDVYINQNIQETVYSGGHFAVPRQEELPVNIHDWGSASGTKASMVAPSQSHVSSGELNSNWCTGENGWSSFEIAVGVGHNFVSGSSSDQTLFSVISECNELRPQASSELVGPAELLVQDGNHGGIPLSRNFLQQSPNRLNYFGSQDAISAGVKMNNNLGWIGMPQQNSGMQGSIGKPFLRWWNNHRQG
ncbi:uncharacterized protein LOC127257816 [Andrographis paniculata]|uniref:uncharacterized protein LOC127257816 n=1 Tax=Andrographis paniculata TaxID=175694 RepID=UPI0021E8C692|nr:uncharacterized protein LOC127257816 [Andrographis paniculata]XP_051140242.1 uncharacterized protein LOC127257816 [Andrographis paniculata]XP_051140243.1 uncharacterized protein LOC127257816 [Andrographis paniculata]XP_051140244.1 uncharacterized protein LOC127257816 [Andrographis paniculata]XP_051140245.1 uncharacterized protein LOC127257816 [Andrographis paniculata]